jgi:nucleoside-diphosphate kinase
MIKPDAFANGHSGAILDIILKAGFKLIALKMIHLSAEKAGEFYAIHRQRPFYRELVEFMSRGPIIAAILEKDNAVADFRKLIGATDPSKAEKGTIRQLYS